MKGFLVYPTYEVRDNKAFVYLFGRLENGESFLTINSYTPYFYILTKEKKHAAKLEPDRIYKDTTSKTFVDEKVTKVILENPKDVPKVKRVFLDEGIQCFEADIRFAYRFLIDNDIKGAMDIDGHYEVGETIDRIYKEPDLSPTSFFPKLKMLSFDIETDKNAGDLYSISLYTEDYKKVLLVKEGKFKNAESFTTEEEVLERFQELVRELDPDVIVGWNVIDFDLAYLRKKFKQYKLPFVLGRVNWPCKLRLSESFFRDSSADIPGRAVLDGIHLMKISFIKLDDYKLNTAAKQILGDEKIFQGAGRHDEITESYHNDPQKLVDYNLKDSKLVYDIIEKADLLNLTVRRSLLTRMQLDRVNASIASFDALYLRELQERKLVAPSAVHGDRDERILGGFVMDPQPGIYDNVIVVDFKSLYPSIIRTFNIDPASFVPKSFVKGYKKTELIEAPNGAHFKRKDGVLPNLIQELWEQRNEAKKRKDKLATYALKILMNSFFGVMANPTFRFYSVEMANAITHFGQFIIKMCAKEIERLGYEVIYGDTDSIFINPKVKSYTAATKTGKEIAETVNTFFKKFVKKEYTKESFLELEFEKVYKKLFLPRVRKKEEGAKKRYSGLLDKKGKEELEFVGLEFVRRDWTDAARKFQHDLHWKVFHDENPTIFVRKFVKELQAGKYDDLLIYRKGIRKSVKEYTKTTPPHIKAARKAGIKKVGIIEYYMTVDGPEAVGFHKSKLDYEHYIDKQIKPIAEAILMFFDEKFENVSKEHKQVSLGDF